MNKVSNGCSRQDLQPVHPKLVIDYGGSRDVDPDYADPHPCWAGIFLKHKNITKVFFT